MSYFIFPMYMMLNRWMENIARLYVVYRFQLSNYFISQNKLYITYIIRMKYDRMSCEYIFWCLVEFASGTLHQKEQRERKKYIYILSQAFCSFVKALFQRPMQKMGENVKSDLRSIFKSVYEKMFLGKGNCWYKIAEGNHFERRLLVK